MNENENIEVEVYDIGVTNLLRNVISLNKQTQMAKRIEETLSINNLI